MDPFIGEIRTVGFNFAPQGWALCEGQLLSIAQHNALFALLGTTYGGDGRSTFALPDLRGRSAVGQGHGAGLNSISWGERGGRELVYLQTSNLPPHSASVSLEVAVPASTSTDDNTAEPGTNKHLGPIVSGGRDGSLYSSSAPDTTLAPFPIQGTTSPVGGGVAVETRDPYLGTYFIIALTGVFPSRS